MRCLNPTPLPIPKSTTLLLKNSLEGSNEEGGIRFSNLIRLEFFFHITRNFRPKEGREFSG